MAAAHVSGVAALVSSTHLELSASQVKRCLVEVRRGSAWVVNAAAAVSCGDALLAH